MKSYELITILGPTASGKTTFAAALAAQLDTEIISADSRQIYRSMDIGTGKDLADYNVNGKQIPYHLIDICEPGYKYNVFEYQHDFFRVYEDMKRRGKLPILCGGTGMYIEAVLKGYQEYAYKRGVFTRPFLNYLYAMVPYVIQEDELVQVLQCMKDWFAR
jgi:tRNA dimethylallyltransferase